MLSSHHLARGNGSTRFFSKFQLPRLNWGSVYLEARLRGLYILNVFKEEKSLFWKIPFEFGDVQCKLTWKYYYQYIQEQKRCIQAIGKL